MAKLGKGYRNGIPIGIESGKCDECNGIVIAVQMATDVKGMTTTSEKVCKECGLIHNQSFPLLDRYEEPKPKYQKQYTEPVTEIDDTMIRYMIKGTSIEPYTYQDRIPYQETKGKIEDIIPYTKGNIDAITPTTASYTNTYHYYYETHDDWWEYNKPEGYQHEGIDLTYEYIIQILGERPGPKSIRPIRGKNGKSSYRINLAFGRGGRIGAMIRSDKQNWRKTQYKYLASEYGYELGMMPYQVDEVKYIIDHKSMDIFKIDYKVDDIVYALCMYQLSSSLNSQKFAAICRRSLRWNKKMKRLYSLIVQKMNG